MHLKTVCSAFATRAVVSGLVIAFAASGWVFGQGSPAPVAPPAYKAEEPTSRSLDATLYMQTAAEYRASCYQAYNLAAMRLSEAVALQKAESATKPLAVVMDLDETVFDNSRFQSMLLRNDLSWDGGLWKAWEEKDSDEITLIPGAKEFILEAKNLRVSVIFVSNRDDKFREQAKKALTRLQIPLEAESLLKLSTGSSDKTARFQEAEREYTVLLHVGDNLRDFDDKLRGDKIEEQNPTDEKLDGVIKARKEAVDGKRESFGKNWIILPNPTYGEWKGPLGRGQRDFDRLVPSASRIPLPPHPATKCNMTFWIPLIILVLCIVWTLIHWPNETDLEQSDRTKFREYLVLDIRANSQYCYWYLALIGVIATIVAFNKSYFAPILNQEHLWPFGLSFFAASLALLFIPAGYGASRTPKLRFVWLRSVVCEQIVVIFTCYGIWEAFRMMTSTVH